MRNFLIILFVAVCSYSFTDVTKPYTFVPRDTIKSSKINANYDSVYSRINDLYDSLEIKFLRFNDFKDSTIDSIKVNKIRSNPDIDSIQGLNVIKGNPIFDSIQGVDIIRGNPNIDSISGTTKFSDTVTFSKLINVDSLYSTRGSSCSILRANRAIIADSISVAGNSNIVTQRDTTFACSLFDGTKYETSENSTATITGNVVVIKFGNLSATIDSTTCYFSLPRALTLGCNMVWCPISISTGSGQVSGHTLIYQNSDRMGLYKYDNSGVTGGACGISYSTITYSR